MKLEDQQGHLLHLEKKYADGISELRKLRALEDENARLKRLVRGGRAGATVVIPIDGLSAEHGSHRRLVSGEGMPPIAVRYQSTTRYAIWVAIAVGIVALAGWILGFFG